MRPSRRLPGLASSRTACSPAPTSARPSTPSTPRGRASVRPRRGWCGDCTSRPLPPDGHCALAPSRSPQCDSAAVCAHPCAPDESLTRDLYPYSGRVRRGQGKLLLCLRLGGKARVRSARDRMGRVRTHVFETMGLRGTNREHRNRKSNSPTPAAKTRLGWGPTFLCEPFLGDGLFFF